MIELEKRTVENTPLDMLLKPFATIGHDWMLVTAGSSTARGQWNTMTASWGSFGVFWNRRTVTCVIRPSRHTYQFTERENLLTFSFFGDEMKKALEVCGSVSGRNTDKAQAAGLTPLLLESGAVGFAEARLNLVCRKLFVQDMQKENFLDETLLKNYPEGDFHRIYICEILTSYGPKREDY